LEKKDDTKEKIGRIPDDADALNLAFYEGGGVGISLVTPEPLQRNRPRRWKPVDRSLDRRTSPW
jgi:hypothetical protein